jgi:hypothetical protein
MKIEACEDSSGDPMYIVEGHVNLAEFQEALATREDFGEDAETAAEYHYSHAYQRDDGPSSRWPDGGFTTSLTPLINSRAISMAATWKPRAITEATTTPEAA